MSIITEARFKMQDGTEALFVAEAADMPRLPEWPFLAIHVEDLDAAKKLLATLERSRAREKSGEKDEPAKDPPAPQWGCAGAEKTWHLWWADSSEAACGATSDAEIVFAEPVEGETPVCYRCARRAGPKADRKRKEPGPGPLPPKCIAPNCDVEAVPGKDACAMHENVGESVLAEWRRAKEKEQGRKRAQKLREGVEGEPGKVVA